MTLDRAKEFTGTQDVREQHRFDVAKLQAFMEEHVDGFSGALNVSQFKGGQSNPTFLLEAGGKRYVMRRKPPGELLKSAHAVDREYKVITALGQTAPVRALTGADRPKPARDGRPGQRPSPPQAT